MAFETCGGPAALWSRDLFIRTRTLLLHAVNMVYGQSMHLIWLGSLNWLCVQ